MVVAEVSTFQLEATPAFLPDAAVLTNLTEDHQDRHGSMEAYGALKRRLFLRDGDRVDVAVVGVDQEFGRGLAAELDAAGARVTRVGEHESADVRLLDSTWRDGSAHVRVDAAGTALELSLPLPGRHNALNGLMALALGEAVGAQRTTAVGALAGAAAPPGRLQRVEGLDGRTVLVDYAHTPDGVRPRWREPARSRSPGPCCAWWRLRVELRRAPPPGSRRGGRRRGRRPRRSRWTGSRRTSRWTPPRPATSRPRGPRRAPTRRLRWCWTARRRSPGRSGAPDRATSWRFWAGACAASGVAPDGEFAPRDDEEMVRAVLARQAEGAEAGGLASPPVAASSRRRPPLSTRRTSRGATTRSAAASPYGRGT